MPALSLLSSAVANASRLATTSESKKISWAAWLVWTYWRAPTSMVKEPSGFFGEAVPSDWIGGVSAYWPPKM